MCLSKKLKTSISARNWEGSLTGLREWNYTLLKVLIMEINKNKGVLNGLRDGVLQKVV